MKEKISNEIMEFRVLLRSVPSLLIIFFVLSVCSMNLLANKSLTLPVTWLALDAGITVSWFAFLAMDMLTRRFGPKAATQLSILAMLGNLCLCLFFFAGSSLPGVWGESYVPGSESLINTALDNTFRGTWYVLAGSSAAFLLSAIVNNFVNWSIGMAIKRNPSGFGAYAARSYISTAIGQFTDNLAFALIVSHNFFGWTMLQCVTCALTGMVVELLCEVIFSGIGYRVSSRWEKEDVGKEYLDLRKAAELTAAQ
ncbi:MAG: VUT family protein [Lachnospiraceae bacterium]|nr:VUT family protein [Lachnospiraceae bacterium]